MEQKKIDLRKFDGKSINILEGIVLRYKVQIKLNSKEEMMNLFQFIMKYLVDIESISVYINDTFESYVKTMIKILSTHKVIVSV